jgi:hypothetical protein
VPDEFQPLTDDELHLMASLLRRFSASDLDQWENWRFTSPYGEVYVSMSRAPAPGATPIAYDNIDAWVAGTVTEPSESNEDGRRRGWGTSPANG